MYNLTFSCQTLSHFTSQFRSKMTKNEGPEFMLNLHVVYKPSHNQAFSNILLMGLTRTAKNLIKIQNDNLFL